jgi:hypothetical protein
MPDQEDYWSPDLGKKEIVTPVALMRAQANLLGERTRQQIIADVRNLSAGSPDQIIWSFQLISPVLGSYRYELFRVFHAVQVYPARINWEGHPDKEVNSQEAFKTALREILGSKQTTDIVDSLLAQARS